MVASFEALDVVVVQCAPTSLARLLDVNLPEGADGVDSVRAMLGRAEVAWRPVNPTELPAPADGAPRFILGGLCDRLAHPVDHGAELWQHWGRPPAHWYQGSHLVSRGPEGVAEFIDDALRQTLLRA